MADQQLNLGWSVERRPDFLEFHFYWKGHMKRGHVVEIFGVWVCQALTDINRYIDLVANSLAYDKCVGSYELANAFEPQLLKPDASTVANCRSYNLSRPEPPRWPTSTSAALGSSMRWLLLLAAWILLRCFRSCRQCENASLRSIAG